MRRSEGVPALRSVASRCSPRAHSTAPTTEPNSIDQHTVAGRFHDPPAVLGDQQIGGAAVLAQSLRRTHLVCLHQPRVAGYLRSRDRGETTRGRGHGWGWPPGFEDRLC
jgi:hypothetical protein